jgi:protoporphyrinogen/coproporphyrinogen III oxidase
VAEEFAEATGAPENPVESDVTRWGGALPQYTVGHNERIARVLTALDAAPGLAVCGAAYDGVGIPACIAGAESAALRVLRHLRDARQ